MRAPILLTLVLVLSACGGGGGGAPPAGEDPPPTGTDARTQEILQGCLPLALTEATNWADRMQDVFDGNGSTQSIQIEPGGVLVDPPPPDTATSVAINWAYDPDGGRVDGTGVFSFEDDQGTPVQPFPQNDLDTIVNSEDIDDLGTILLNIAEGTRLLADYNAPELALRTATLDVTFTGGAPGSTDGTLGVFDTDCGTQLSWTGITMADLQGDLATTFPSGAFDVTVNEGTDVVVGTLTLDGTRTATATVSRNGEAATNWQIDLVTGVATQV
jgi:hypothetical protein